MAVMRIMEATGATTDDYDRANEIMRAQGGSDAPDGLIEHVIASDGASITIVDVWESEEALNRFAEERLAPAMAEAGLGGGDRPASRTLPVHNRLRGRGQSAGVLLLVEIDGFTPDLYDTMTEGMDEHVGDGNHPSVWHAVGRTESGGLVVADVWESAEAFGDFAQKVIGPRGAEVGLPEFEPRLIPVHNDVRGKSAQPAG